MAAAGALEGVRVLDLSGEAGQFCGKLLGDFGADVILRQCECLAG